MKDWCLPSQGNLIPNACDREDPNPPPEQRGPFNAFAYPVSVSLPGGTTLGPGSSGGTSSTAWIQVTQAQPMKTKPQTFPGIIWYKLCCILHAAQEAEWKPRAADDG